MRTVITSVLVLGLSTCAVDRAHPEIYLNRQWDELHEQWVTKGLSLHGISPTVDRS